MSRRYKDRRRPEEDNFVESLQSDNRSEAESTVLSSVLPIVTSRHVRANAPRASLPSDAGSDHGRTTVSGVSSDIRNKKSDGLANEMDEYTVETNLPIDSVYIYPSSPQQTNHRQRRNYRSGQRSVGDMSSRASSVGNFSNGGAGGASVSGSVGGILETLGLGSTTLREDDEEDPMADGGTGKNGKPALRDYYSRANGRAKSSNGGGSAAAAGTQVHLRAALVLFFLMSILYGAFQWISMAKANSKFLQSKKAKNKNRHYKAFSEGEDRPVDKSLVSRISAMSAGKISEHLAKVPKKDEGPEAYLDSTKKELYIEKEETPDKAPADKLDAIDKDEEDAKADLSLAVKSGLAGVYSKDPNHSDIPFLWYIPRSGGGMVKNILSNCKDLVVASEVGATVAKKGTQDKLEVIEVGGHKYLNVDTTTQAGIIKAKALGLASSGLANLVVSPRLQDAASLFGPAKKGRTFALLRHPVERAVSMFFFLKKHKVAAVASMELDDYCKSPHVENNWMVRILSDKMTGDVGDDDLEMAKKLLKEKMIIGLLEQKEESMRRFEFYFGWRYTENPQRQESCRTRILVGDYRTNESAKSKIKEGSQAWSLLMWQNKLDMKLYKYAKALFLQQGTELFNDMP
jgi:hypothetical protein